MFRTILHGGCGVTTVTCGNLSTHTDLTWHAFFVSCLTEYCIKLSLLFQLLIPGKIFLKDLEANWVWTCFTIFRRDLIGDQFIKSYCRIAGMLEQENCRSKNVGQFEIYNMQYYRPVTCKKNKFLSEKYHRS